MSDLSELFQRDPLSLTRDDLTKIVTELRSRRAQFALGAQKAGSMKAPTAKQKAIAGLGISLDLGSILGEKK